MKEKKARVEDALHATRAAVEEGIVPGGGVAYLRSIKALDEVKTDNEDQKLGVEIIRRAVEEPIRLIVENAGLEGSVVVNKIKEGKDDFGFNAQTEKYENLIQAGVIDPTKVARIALENAASVAGLLLTTEATIVEKPEKDKTPPMPHGGGMGRDMSLSPVGTRLLWAKAVMKSPPVLEKAEGLSFTIGMTC